MGEIFAGRAQIWRGTHGEVRLPAPARETAQSITGERVASAGMTA
jgi:hypothetical protein